jgi:hypothetical protein
MPALVCRQGRQQRRQYREYSKLPPGLVDSEAASGC